MDNGNQSCRSERGIDGLSKTSGRFGHNASGEAIDAAFDHSLLAHREQARRYGGRDRIEDDDGMLFALPELPLRRQPPREWRETRSKPASDIML